MRAPRRPRGLGLHVCPQQLVEGFTKGRRPRPSPHCMLTWCVRALTFQLGISGAQRCFWGSEQMGLSLNRAGVPEGALLLFVLSEPVRLPRQVGRAGDVEPARWSGCPGPSPQGPWPSVPPRHVPMSQCPSFYSACPSEQCSTDSSVSPAPGRPGRAG